LEYVAILVIGALTFGVCFLVDSGAKRLFRNKVQHLSGMSVRLNQRYATIGLILAFLGVCAIFAGAKQSLLLLVGGILVLLIGIGLVVYYCSFGIYYDDDSFLFSSFGKRSCVYRYNQIQGQLLYNAGGNILVELQLKDGNAVMIQATMVGAVPFLDYAFQRWCFQLGKNPESCDFHDTEKSIWFPMMEGK
jgi:hypothetical protein